MNVILSIKPQYAAAIVTGRKAYEFRKVIFKARPIDRIYIYSSAPVKKLVGSFAPGEIVEGHPDQLWERCNGGSGLTDAEFFAYFKGRAKGYAIPIADLEILATPIDPWTIFPGFTPPQSFCYCDRPSIS